MDSLLSLLQQRFCWALEGIVVVMVTRLDFDSGEKTLLAGSQVASMLWAG
jgi:hypothetical protein